MANNRLLFADSTPSIQYVYDVVQIQNTATGLLDVDCVGIVENYNVGDVVLLYSPLNGPTPNEFVACVVYDVTPSLYADITLRLSYDYNVYTYSSSISYGAMLFTTYDFSKSIENCSPSHTLSVSISNSAYSDRYVLYSSKRTYELKLNDIRRRFFDDIAGYSDAISAQTLFFVDDCFGLHGAAYKLFSDSASFELLNNKFRKTIDFKVAT